MTKLASLVLENDYRKIWQSPESFTSTLTVLAADTYGYECFQWSPVTLRWEIEEDFHVKLPPANMDRLMAGIYLLTSNEFYQSLPDFIDICNVLSGGMFHPELFEPATLEDVCWGITEAMLLSPPDEEIENPFPEDIVGYISELLKMEGILTPPDVLRIAGIDQELTKRITYDWSEDEEMMQTIWTMEKSKSDDITDVVKSRLFLLLNQLKTLPLVHGDTSGIVEKMMANLSKYKV